VSHTDFSAQVRKALDNLKEVLESAGTSLDRVLSVRCWVSDWEDWEAMDAIYVTYFTRDPSRFAPPSSLVCFHPTCSRSRPSLTWTSSPRITIGAGAAPEVPLSLAGQLAGWPKAVRTLASVWARRCCAHVGPQDPPDWSRRSVERTRWISDRASL